MGLVEFKSDLRNAVMDRLGDFEQQKFYSIATLLDPRWKHIFYRMPNTAETALEYVVQEVEIEMEKGQQLYGDLSHMEENLMETASSIESDGASISILEQIRKRIRLEKLGVSPRSVSSSLFVQAAVPVPEVTARSLVEEYLAMPQTEHECLRYFSSFCDT